MTFELFALGALLWVVVAGGGFIWIIAQMWSGDYQGTGWRAEERSDGSPTGYETRQMGEKGHFAVKCFALFVWIVVGMFLLVVPGVPS